MRDPEKGKAGAGGHGESVRHGTSPGSRRRSRPRVSIITPQDALAFTTSADLPKIMDLVRSFCFKHNLLGDNVKSIDAIGIEMPAGSLGAKDNVKLRFDPTYMKLAAEGKI